MPAHTHRLVFLILLVTITVACTPQLHAQPAPPQVRSVPPELQPPANEQLFLQVHAKGVQIYTCKAVAPNQFAWTLKAPEAQLLDKDGKPFGKHYAGPTWQAADGSTISGKAVASVSPDPHSIPWLLVNVTDHNGQGVLSPVTLIQRRNTKGGKAPATGCEANHAGSEVRVSYTADYYFFIHK